MGKKNKVVEIICVMDRSGSMGGIMDEVVSTFNAFVDKQKELPGKAALTLVTFDHEYEVLMDRLPLNDVWELTPQEVMPRGMTALNDAIGTAINNTTAKKAIMLIQTDGEENSSKEYKTADIKALVQKKEKEGWEISFIGADIDAFEAGASFGVAQARCVNITKDKGGMDKFSAYAGAQTMSYRSNNS